MNRVIKILFVALVLVTTVILTFASCKKKDDSEKAFSQPEYSQKDPEYEEPETGEDPTLIEELATVTAYYYNDVAEKYPNYIEFAADQSSSSQKIFFVAEGEVRDFKFLELEFEGVGEADTLMYSEVEVYSVDMLHPLTPLLVTLSFFGDAPIYGISYVDETGTVRSFALEMSGTDSSLILNEF